MRTNRTLCNIATAWRAIFALTACLPAASGIAQTERDAFEFDVVYTAEVWRNFTGGLEDDSVYLDNLDATLMIDGGALWGAEGTRIFLYALYNNGRSLSGSTVGDEQIISNIETGVEALRLYEAWIETPVADKGSLLFGLFDLNSEFDVLDSSALFINSAHGIGTDFGLSGRNGPSIFPVTSLALRFHWQWDEHWAMRTAVFDGVPGDPDDPGATAVRLGGSDGALLVTELEWADDHRRLLAGAWRYTADFDEWPDASAPDVVRRSDGNGGLYLRGETALDGIAAGLEGFARIGVAEGDFNVFSGFFSAGLNWRVPSAARPDNAVGLAIAWAEVSEAFQDANGGEEREIHIEFTYRMPLGERLTVQPDIQYVINPGLDPALDHAWVAGLRFEFSLVP